MYSNDSDGGFVTIEALVAMTILALAMGALYQVVSNSLRTAARIAEDLEITTKATDVFDAFGGMSAQDRGTLSGGNSWVLIARPIGTFETSSKRGLHFLAFEVRDPAGRSLARFVTIK